MHFESSVRISTTYFGSGRGNTAAMPALKTFFSSSGLGKLYKHDCKANDEPPQPKRPYAKLQKGHKSSINILHGMGKSSNSKAESSPQSYKASQSVHDFEAELRAVAQRPKNEYLVHRKPLPVGDGSLVSRLGLKVNPAAATKSISSTLSTPNLLAAGQVEQVPEKIMPTLGRYNLIAHPDNLREVVGSRLNPYEDAMMASASWSGPDVLPYLKQRAESSKAREKSRIPSAEDKTWVPIEDSDALIGARNYGMPKAEDLKLQMSCSRGDTAALGTIVYDEDERLKLRRELDIAMAAWYEAERKLAKVVQPKRDVAKDQDTQEHFEELLRQQADSLVLLQQYSEEVDRIALSIGHHEVAAQDRLRARERIEEQIKERMERVDREEQELWDRMWREEEELLEQLKREEEARLAAEHARLRDCAVCGDSKEPLEFPAKAPTSRCEHPATTCDDCLQTWMASEFETKGCDGIKCPECPQTLEYNDVQAAASAETFEAYDKLATRLALGNLEEFGWCLQSGCNSGQFNVESGNYMDCVNCHYKQCLKHKVPWHTSETCDQYDYRTSGQKARDEESKTQAMLDSISKKCPGLGCNWRIQKIDGCDHMTCKRCKHEFCWQCMASQNEIRRLGNTAHVATCQYHSNNLNVAWPFNVH